MDEDRLIELLRERANDPDRRVDERPSAFEARVQSLDLSQLLGHAGGLSDALRQLVSQIQGGEPVDPKLHEAAQDAGRELNQPAAAAELPGPALPEALAQLERTLAAPLPGFLRRVYLEVADGGFGPGGGLLSVAELESTHRQLLGESPAETGDPWPPELLALQRLEPACACLDTGCGRIVWYDLDEVERDGEVVYGPVVSDLAATPQAWLAEWVAAPPPPPRFMIGPG